MDCFDFDFGFNSGLSRVWGEDCVEKERRAEVRGGRGRKGKGKGGKRLGGVVVEKSSKVE